jgi:uncharacterized membrane protein
MTRRQDLTTPRQGRRLGVSYDSEAFGQFAETIARYLGTAKFIVIQTIVVIIWIVLNVFFVVFRWDKYPFILLNLAFSTQAAYAAPLILLAQNRQELRERSQTDNDRRVAERTQVDTEFLARELAGVRLALGDVVTTEDLRDHLDELTRAVTALTQRFAESVEQPPVEQRKVS